MSKVKINILSPGRFHVLDLARELNKEGFDVRFYSFVPWFRAKKFGLPYHCSKSVFAFMAPFLFVEKILGFRPKSLIRLRRAFQDIMTSFYMRKCDICIAMSGSFLFAPKRAKKQGAIVILERGSKHILEQKRILEAIPSLQGTKPVPDINVKRELTGYCLADYISVPSRHALSSFLDFNFPQEKMLLNPYGVNLSNFFVIPDTKKVYDVIMVGSWSYQKGCDLIIDAVQQLNLSLLHVGGITDIPFPNCHNFTHINPVDETELVYYYNKAKIFVMPSRQDGFGLVFSQALACNLPIVGSPDCGAPDLKEIISEPKYIQIIEDYTAESVKKSIETTLTISNNLGITLYAGEALKKLSWQAYGKRYAEFLKSHILCD